MSSLWAAAPHSSGPFLERKVLELGSCRPSDAARDSAQPAFSFQVKAKSSIVDSVFDFRSFMRPMLGLFRCDGLFTSSLTGTLLK